MVLIKHTEQTPVSNELYAQILSTASIDELKEILQECVDREYYEQAAITHKVIQKREAEPNVIWTFNIIDPSKTKSGKVKS